MIKEMIGDIVEMWVITTGVFLTIALGGLPVWVALYAIFTFVS